MPPRLPQPRSNTSEEILDIAEMLIETRGYSAISYQDISEQLGIRKASIHYHFPSKTDLGAAVVERYMQRFEQALAELEGDASKTAMQMFEAYTVPYMEFADTPDRICLCGALAGEILALPAPVRALVQRHFVLHQEWLARLLRRGARSGEFNFPGQPPRMARHVLAALQGALLIKRATGSLLQLSDTIAMIRSQLQSH
ncbi:MAG: TetR/AcrR family transcriptional regulator [Alphaproteobacteria bacterium]|nr:TetR/AcrR family transcriptional regulator [Alphaproteobacteria bacterium]